MLNVICFLGSFHNKLIVKSRIGILLVLVICSFYGGSEVTAGVLLDGDFEKFPTLQPKGVGQTWYTNSPWYTTAAEVQAFGVFHSGTRGLQLTHGLNSVVSLGGFSQTIATNAGESYTLSFWYANDIAGARLKVTFGGNTLTDETLSATFSNLDASTPGAWIQKTISVTATSNSTELTFLGQRNSYTNPRFGITIDDVSLESNGSINPTVPEPTSMAIFGLGALGMAYRARRETKAKAKKA